MDVVEAPEMRVRDVLPGAILIFTLDPVASVADLNDEEATAAAASLRPGRSLVMVRRRDIDSAKPLHTQPLAFYLFSIGHGLPHPPYACVGLSPEAVHPRGRAPILPSIPLPWPDCYVHPFMEFAATITRMHLSPTGPVSTVTKEEHLSVLTALFNDSAAFVREQEGGQSSNEGTSDSASPSVTPADDAPVPALNGPTSRSPSRTCSGDSGDSEDGEDSSGSRGSASESGESVATDLSGSDAATGESSNESHSDSNSNSIANPAQGSPALLPRSPADFDDGLANDPPMLRLRGEIWLDVSAFDDFDPPQHMAKLLEDLSKIETEWAKRKVLKMLADQPRTEQWASEVAAVEPADDIQLDRPIDQTSPADDDILPEDAIDDRIERANHAASRVAEGGRKKASSTAHGAASRPVGADQPALLHISSFGAAHDPAGQTMALPPSSDLVRTVPHISTVGQAASPEPAAHVPPSADGHARASSHISTAGAPSSAGAPAAREVWVEGTSAVESGQVPDASTAAAPASRAGSVHDAPSPRTGDEGPRTSVGNPTASEAPALVPSSEDDQLPAAPNVTTVGPIALCEPAATVGTTRPEAPAVVAEAISALPDGTPATDTTGKSGKGRLWPAVLSRLRRIRKATLKPLKHLVTRLRLRVGTKA